MNYSTLEKINEEVNRLIYVSDKEQFGVEDFWEDVTEIGRGDCDDSVITKLRRLIDLGWPLVNLRIAIVGVEKAGDHAVLCAKTDNGKWWVLDNRYPHPMTPALLPYTWQQWGMGKDWHIISWK